MPESRSKTRNQATERRPQRQGAIARDRRGQALRRWIVLGAAALVVVIVAIVAVLQFGRQNSSASGPTPGSAISGVPCVAEMTQVHFHIALLMYRNGQRVPLPGYIGQPYSKQINVNGQNTCFYWLHTHDFDSAAGIVHAESPNPVTFKLGQFFDIWHYTALWDAQSDPTTLSLIDPTFVNALRAANAAQIHAFVNGKPYTGDYRDIVFSPHKVIAVEIGSPVRQPPAKITFPQGD